MGREATEEKMFEYLDDLRESGDTNLTRAQLSLMEKLKAGDILSGDQDAYGWRFWILRDRKMIALRRVSIATVRATETRGALLPRMDNNDYSGNWQPTAEGLAAYRAEVGG